MFQKRIWFNQAKPGFSIACKGAEQHMLRRAPIGTYMARIMNPTIKILEDKKQIQVTCSQEIAYQRRIIEGSDGESQCGIRPQAV